MSRISNEESTVVGDESLLQLVLALLVNVLLVVGDNGLGYGLTDGVDLRDMTTTGDPDADVDVGELVESDDEQRLVDLFTNSKVNTAISYFRSACQTA